MKAKLTNLLNGETIEVTSTTDHPASSYMKAVWVDKNGQAYARVGMPIYGYEIEIIDE